MIGAGPVAEIPAGAGADRTPEDRGVARDGVRLLVTTPTDDLDARFDELPRFLRRGDLLVVNESATLPAALAARGARGPFLAHVSTHYGGGLWLLEPRSGPGRPGPLPIVPGEEFALGGVRARWVASFPGVPRLGFAEVAGDLRREMDRAGRPIRYGYLAREYPLARYQTVFAREAGSAEMPSAGGPFTPKLVERLRLGGVRFAPIVLHSGVSSLESGDVAPGTPPVLPEEFRVPESTVRAIAATRESGGRVVAVGTTVLRALESAVDGGVLRPAQGFTRLFLNVRRAAATVDGLLTGFHDARSTHLELLASVGGVARLRRSYATAVARGYLWHEFGDAQLLWAAASGAAR